MQDTEQILMRIHEFRSLTQKSEIVISYGGGRTERIELATSAWRESREANAAQINAVIATIRQSGYEIVSASSGGAGDMITTTYVFGRQE